MGLWSLIREDFATVRERDPATGSSWAVFTLHSGFWAVAAHRVQHWLWCRGLRWLARWLAMLSRLFTGVEIHPAVKAGRRLFIDHGMGIVIGETAELGDDVSIYQGVTLGGTSWRPEKRHPPIGDNVFIGHGRDGTQHHGGGSGKGGEEPPPGLRKLRALRPAGRTARPGAGNVRAAATAHLPAGRGAEAVEGTALGHFQSISNGRAVLRCAQSFAFFAALRCFAFFAPSELRRPRSYRQTGAYPVCI